MAQITGPKFACASCGKQYSWKPELAGRKAKCKCGAVLSVPAQPPVEAEPEAEPEPRLDMYDIADDAPPKKAPAHAAAPPSLASMATATAPAPAGRAGGTVYRPPPPPPEGAKAPMNVRGSLKYLGFGVLLGAFAALELNFPTDPDAPARKWRAILKLANNVHPRGAFAVLALMSAALLLMGVLVLLGKMSDEEEA